MAEIYDSISIGLQVASMACKAWKARRDRRKKASDVITETAKVNRCVYAMPIINDLDKIYIYSPYNLERGTIQPYNVSSIVEFSLWSNSGYLHMKATDLSFTFALPILESDQIYDQVLSGPLRNWQSRNSDRFYLVKLYLAYAADAADGRFASIHSFCQKCKGTHPDHEIVKDSDHLISVEIPGFALDPSFPDSTPRGEKWYATLTD